MKRKIVFINSFFNPNIGGGAEITCELVVRSMMNRGFDVAVIATKNHGHAEISEIDGIKVHRVPIDNIYWHFHKNLPAKWKRAIWHLMDLYNPLMKRKVARILNDERPDIVFCHNLSGLSGSIWDACLERDIPVVQVLHDMYLACPSTLMYKGGRICNTQCTACATMRFYHKKKSKHIDAVVGVSEFILTAFRDLGYFCNSKKYVIHNIRSVEIPYQRQAPNSRNIKIGYIGTISKAKGVDWLFQQMDRSLPGVELILAGTSVSDFADEMADKYPNVPAKFLGFVKSKIFFDQIDICVVPSLWPEALGTVAIEACANRVPVIVSNVGGLPEIVKDGHNGLVCSVNRPDSLGEALVRLVGDCNLWQDISNCGPNSVAHFLSEARFAEEYELMVRYLLDSIPA